MKKTILTDHIPLMRPWLGRKECAAVAKVIMTGWVSQGPKVIEFEQALSSFIGARYCVAVNACTSALHLALAAHGIRSGDEVILPDFTCMADANAVLMAGAVPVFADIDASSFCLSPEAVKRRITARTRAIVTVDQIGLASDLDSLKRIARNQRLVLIDDAATSLGAEYKKRPLGAHGLTTTFSFHPRKMITTGEGGVLVTDNERIARQARILRSTGASVSDLTRHKARGVILQKYYHRGFNYRMTDIQAAVGIVQMEKLGRIIEERNRQAAYYARALQQVKELELPGVPAYARHAFSSYLLRVKDPRKYPVSSIIKTMAAKKISCRFGIQPLHREPFFRGHAGGDSDFPVSCDVGRRSFFVPIFPGLTRRQQDFVIVTLKHFFARG